MLACLVAKDGEQDSHTQQDRTEEEEEENELADMPVPLVPIWLSRYYGRHGQKRKGFLVAPCREAEMCFLLSRSFRLCKQQ